MFKIVITGIQDWGYERCGCSVSSEESFHTVEEAIIAFKNGEYNCDTNQLDEILEYIVRNENEEDVFELT